MYHFERIQLGKQKRALFQQVIMFPFVYKHYNPLGDGGGGLAKHDHEIVRFENIP